MGFWFVAISATISLGVFFFGSLVSGFWFVAISCANLVGVFSAIWFLVSALWQFFGGNFIFGYLVSAISFRYPVSSFWFLVLGFFTVPMGYHVSVSVSVLFVSLSIFHHR